MKHLTGKDDISQHEKTLANLLHREIFETGRYFKETSEKKSSFCNQHDQKRDGPPRLLQEVQKTQTQKNKLGNFVDSETG